MALGPVWLLVTLQKPSSRANFIEENPVDRRRASFVAARVNDLVYRVREVADQNIAGAFSEVVIYCNSGRLVGEKKICPGEPNNVGW